MKKNMQKNMQKRGKKSKATKTVWQLVQRGKVLKSSERKMDMVFEHVAHRRNHGVVLRETKVPVRTAAA
jgi:hypothetical protein